MIPIPLSIIYGEEEYIKEDIEAYIKLVNGVKA